MINRNCITWIFLASLALGLPGWAASKPDKDIQYSRDIQQILSENCYACHGPDEKSRKAKLRLDTEEGVTGPHKKGEPVVVRGKSSESELIRRLITDDPDDKMPPPDSNRKLTTQQISLLKRWVDQGAPWGKHWAFVTPSRTEPPKVKKTRWVRNSIDAFILARLESEQLRPSEEASKEQWLRRVTLDLNGLPPSLEEIEAFHMDRSPQAHERVVDRLLSNTRYGERMVFDWMDAARYADSNGYQGDPTRQMFPWRDWVIDAYNQNKPFDQFTVEQIAGDLLPNATLPQKIATGFNRNHPLNGEGGRILEETRVEYVVDRVDTTATVWLGVTLACARCHDHKFDPFSQKEYYQLYALYNNVPESGATDRWPNAAPTLSLPTDEQTTRITRFTGELKKLNEALAPLREKHLRGYAEWEGRQTPEIAGLPAPIVEILKVGADKRTADQKNALTDHYLSTHADFADAKKLRDNKQNELKAVNDSIVVMMVMEDQPKPRDSFILQRGAYDKYGEKVSPGLPASLSTNPSAASNRLAFAQWLVDPSNPLTARVAVNRTWQQFFGTGLVKTSEDFGIQGEKPSHPELLDWLAVHFIESGWNVKALHKMIVLSATYRQNSRTTAALTEKDPENRLLARGPRYRLPSWMIRDQALALSGLLVEKVGGPSVKPYQPPGVWEEMSFGQIKYVQDTGPSLYRRSLYTFWRRTSSPTEFFDVATRTICSVRSPRTNTPLQALILLNDLTFVEAARAFAERIYKSASIPEERLVHGFRLATARNPSKQELAILLQRLGKLENEYKQNPEAAAKVVLAGESKRDAAIPAETLAAYTGLTTLLLNLDEVISKE